MDASENDDDDQSEGVDVTDDAFPEALVDESGNVEDLESSILCVSFSADSLNQYCRPSVHPKCHRRHKNIQTPPPLC